MSGIIFLCMRTRFEVKHHQVGIFARVFLVWFHCLSGRDSILCSPLILIACLEFVLIFMGILFPLSSQWEARFWGFTRFTKLPPPWFVCLKIGCVAFSVCINSSLPLLCDSLYLRFSSSVVLILSSLMPPHTPPCGLSHTKAAGF